MLLIAFVINNFSEKSLKFSKTAPSAPFSGTSRPKILVPYPHLGLKSWCPNPPGGKMESEQGVGK